MLLEQKHDRIFEKIIESIFKRGRRRRAGGLVVAREPYGGPRDTSCPLCLCLFWRETVPLWVSSLPLEAQASSFSCTGTTGKATGWDFPLNTLLHFKSSSWHLWDEQLNFCKFNQQNYPIQPSSSQRDHTEI